MNHFKTMPHTVVGSHPISATISKQLKLGQPSLNYMSCYLEFLKYQQEIAVYENEA